MAEQVFGMPSQVMTKGPVEVTIVFSSSLTPVLNLDGKRRLKAGSISFHGNSTHLAGVKDTSVCM
jgi:hypothetical protein